MCLCSEDVPQADLLEDVVGTVRAVANGARTYQEIAIAIGKVERQGRYYRLAAQQIGMIEFQGPNIVVLNERGRCFLQLEPQAQRVFLAEAVLGNPACSGVFNYIVERPNCIRQEIVNYLSNAGIGDSVADRRCSTILNWLNYLGLIACQGTGFFAIWRPAFNGQVFEHVNSEIDGSIIPNMEFHNIDNMWDGTFTQNPNGTITYQINVADRERATINHQRLVSGMASVIRARGMVPSCTRHIDLVAGLSESSYIFEMKSCTEENLPHQIRAGVSQLFEYRYRYNRVLNNPQLWLVLEFELRENNAWYIGYLNSIGINVCWLGLDGRFVAPQYCQNALNVLLGGGSFSGVNNQTI